MLKYVLFVCFLAFAANAEEFYKQCRGKAPVPLAMNVTNCNQPPCDVPNGSHVEMFMDFMLEIPTTTLTVSLEVWWGNIEVPYELNEEEENGCTHLIGVKCPLQPGQMLKYRFYSLVEAPLDGIVVDLIYRFEDDLKRIALCFETSYKIVPAKF